MRHPRFADLGCFLICINDVYTCVIYLNRFLMRDMFFPDPSYLFIYLQDFLTFCISFFLKGRPKRVVKNISITGILLAILLVFMQYQLHRAHIREILDAGY